MDSPDSELEGLFSGDPYCPYFDNLRNVDYNRVYSAMPRSPDSDLEAELRDVAENSSTGRDWNEDLLQEHLDREGVSTEQRAPHHASSSAAPVPTPVPRDPALAAAPNPYVSPGTNPYASTPAHNRRGGATSSADAEGRVHNTSRMIPIPAAGVPVRYGEELLAEIIRQTTGAQTLRSALGENFDEAAFVGEVISHIAQNSPLTRDKRLRSFLQREADRRREIRDPLTPPWLLPANREDPAYWNDSPEGDQRPAPFWLFTLMRHHTAPLMSMVYTLWTNSIVLDYDNAHEQVEEDALQLEQTMRGSQYWAKQMYRLWPDICDHDDMDDPVQILAESVVHIARLADKRTAEILGMTPLQGILDPESPYAFTVEAKLRVVYKEKLQEELAGGPQMGFRIPNWGQLPALTGRATEAVLGADTPYRIVDNYPGPFDNGRTNADYARAMVIHNTTMFGGRPLRPTPAPQGHDVMTVNEENRQDNY